MTLALGLLIGLNVGFVLGAMWVSRRDLDPDSAAGPGVRASGQPVATSGFAATARVPSLSASRALREIMPTAAELAEPAAARRARRA